MNIKALFPSKYVQASDLRGQDVPVQIIRIAIEKVGDEQEECPILYFAGASKGFVMNKTNGSSISAMYGEETDRWIGQTIVLYPSRVAYKGEMVDCIRVRDQIAPQQPAFAPQPPPLLPGYPAQAAPMTLPPGQQHYAVQPPPLPAGYPAAPQYAPQQPPPLPPAAQHQLGPVPGPIPF